MSEVLQERIFHPTYVRLFCSHIRHRGLSLEDALAGTGLTWRQLLHEKRLIALDVMRSLVLSAKRLAACPSLGLEWGVSVEMAAHGLAGTVIATGRDVSQALEAAVRYRPLRGRAVEFELVDAEDCLMLIMREPFDFGDIRTFILEAHVGMLERVMASVAGEPLVGVEYRFPYAPPAWAREYSRWLSGKACFSSEHMELRVPQKLSRLPGIMADDRARTAITFSADRELALQHSGSDFVRQIRRRLSEQQGSYPSARSMAQELNMSHRTFLRKLSQDGTTYQALLDDDRKELAKWYLSKTRVPIGEIAERLGYRESSSFSRAFCVGSESHPTKFERTCKRREARAACSVPSRSLPKLMFYIYQTRP
jgi:AraC-like DNA-binding protein